LTWEVVHTDEFEAWLDEIDPNLEARLSGFVAHLEEHGPQLRAPFATKLKHCPSGRLYELRPKVKGHDFRILYAFDAQRRAVLLHAGDKTGEWDTWYREAIAIAEQRLATHERR
jgi:hypothetical protein